MKTPLITRIIKGAVTRCNMSAAEVARVTGIPYQTLNYRYKYPATWRFCEWGSMLRHVEFTEEELQNIRREVQK